MGEFDTMLRKITVYVDYPFNRWADTYISEGSHNRDQQIVPTNSAGHFT